MFWNGTYVVFREIEQLLEKEPISLSHLIDADDILQECKTQNKKLVEFLVRPDTVAELISLVTEEPSKNMELSRRYRRASMACEILTSEIPGISQLLSNDQNLMNKLCDFVAQPVPLNPLLASFFSKTIEMLLARRPEQDYYSYQIVCLRVLEFFKQRQDFLPNLLKHIGTSAIMDTFKHLIWIEGLEIQPGAMEWLDSYRLIEQLVQIICGTHNIDDVPLCVNSDSEDVKLANGIPEPEQNDVYKESDDDTDKVIHICGEPDLTGEKDDVKKQEEKADSEKMEKSNSEEKLDENSDEMLKETPFDQSLEYNIRVTRERLLAGQSANAAHLLAEIVHMSMEVEYITAQIQKSVSNPLWDKSISQETIELLLQSMFTAPEETREDAIVNGVQVLLAILQDKEFEEIEDVRLRDNLIGHKCALYKSALKGAIAPHLPLLHQVLMQEPPSNKLQLQYGGSGASEGVQRVGRARLAVVSLLERAVCVSACHTELAQVLHALGTLPLLIDMFLKYKWNNFLHTHVKNVFVHMTEYSMFLEYADPDVISRLIDAWEEENDMKNTRKARSGYMGHLTKMLESLSRSLMLTVIPMQLKERYDSFFTQKLAYVLHLESTPLGGHHPADRPESEAVYDENATYGYSSYNSRWSRYEDREDNDFSKNEDNFNTYSKDYYEDRLAEDEEDFRQVKQLLEDRRKQKSEEPDTQSRLEPEPKAAWDDEDEEEMEARRAKEEEIESEIETEEAGQALASSPSTALPLLTQTSPWESMGVTPSTSAEDGWANFNTFGDTDPSQRHAWVSDCVGSFSADVPEKGWADFNTSLPPEVVPPIQAPPANDTEAPSVTETSSLESFPIQMKTAIETIDEVQEIAQKLDEQSSCPAIADIVDINKADPTPDAPRKATPTGDTSIETQMNIDKTIDKNTKFTKDTEISTDKDMEKSEILTDNSEGNSKSDIKDNKVLNDSENKISAEPGQGIEQR